jgi:hypothetical protein
MAPPAAEHGPLVRVAGARHQAEAEMLQGLLAQQGIPTVLRRSAGFDVPDFLAAGPRDVLVREGDVAIARELLGVPEAEAVAAPVPAGRAHAARLLVALVGGGLAAAGLAWALVGPSG